MQEIRRQEYLQVIGVESYIPRWKIPFAAESLLCDQSYESSDQAKDEALTVEPIKRSDQQDQIQPATTLHDVVDDIANRTSVKNSSFRIGDILQHFEDKKSLQIQSFSLSVWRPAIGFLIVAARNVNAMPTELLLNNFLRFYLQHNQLVLSEEILRWPTIENSKMALTEKDACEELQTWLSVQHEFQSINTLWFFGDIYRYFISEFPTSSDLTLIESCDIKLDLAKSAQTIRAKLLPDLSQFLLQTQLKQKLLSLI